MSESHEVHSNETAKGLKDEHEKEVPIHVVHVNETEKASFKESTESTLSQVWDKSYDELRIGRQPTDIFQTDGEHPVSLMNQLNLTLEQARDQKVVKNYHFAIVSETGGA